MKKFILVFLFYFAVDYCFADTYICIGENMIFPNFNMEVIESSRLGKSNENYDIVTIEENNIASVKSHGDDNSEYFLIVKNNNENFLELVLQNVDELSETLLLDKKNRKFSKINFITSTDKRIHFRVIFGSVVMID